MSTDFIVDLFNLIPLKASIVIMFITMAISKLVGRDPEGRLPKWFPWIPMAMGVVLGIPAYLVENVAAIALQPVWATVLNAAVQGITYGATAIGLWSARSIIPYFNKVVDDK